MQKPRAGVIIVKQDWFGGEIRILWTIRTGLADDSYLQQVGGVGKQAQAGCQISTPNGNTCLYQRQ